MTFAELGFLMAKSNDCNAPNDFEKWIVKELEKCPWEKWFELERYKNRHNNLATIVARAVSGSTFRAFSSKSKSTEKAVAECRPSLLFRSWAVKMLNRWSFNDFERINSPRMYADWRNAMGESLRRSWPQRRKLCVNKYERWPELEFGVSLKLINLLAKELCSYNQISDERWKEIVKYIDVPLDAYTIQAVAHCGLEFSNARKRLGNIPPNAGMGDVEEPCVYEDFQKCIRKLTKQAGKPPIAFDITFWGTDISDVCVH